jgi:hypothetical protein
MTNQTWENKFDDEIAHARSARAVGNEGMARVCARRAGGLVVGEYLRRQGRTVPSENAYDLLRYLREQPGTPVHLQKRLDRLLLRVNSEHQLPVQGDLISDAEWLRHTLLID